MPKVGDDLDAKYIQDIQSNLQSNGPVCVLLSYPVLPVTENMPAPYYGPANRTHVFCLIARYIGWCCNADNEPSKLKTGLAVKAVKLISVGMIHSNLSQRFHKPINIGNRNSTLDNINPASIRSVGSQLQNAHFQLFKCLSRDSNCKDLIKASHQGLCPYSICQAGVLFFFQRSQKIY